MSCFSIRFGQLFKGKHLIIDQLPKIFTNFEFSDTLKDALNIIQGFKFLQQNV